MNGIAVGDPHKSCAKKHIAILIESPIPSKTFTQMGVEAIFITATSLAT